VASNFQYDLSEMTKEEKYEQLKQIFVKQRVALHTFE
jgi:hypothetical protein